MAEQTKTEKLEKGITRIIKREFMLITPQDMSKLILKACKEAGLKFIPDTIANAYGDRPVWFENVEEIET